MKNVCDEVAEFSSHLVNTKSVLKELASNVGTGKKQLEELRDGVTAALVTLEEAQQSSLKQSAPSAEIRGAAPPASAAAAPAEGGPPATAGHGELRGCLQTAQTMLEQFATTEDATVDIDEAAALPSKLQEAPAATGGRRSTLRVRLPPNRSPDAAPRALQAR